MPTYAYRCTACAHEFEVVQKMSEDPLKFCPECGAPIKRIIFPAGIVFKGSGWYINDSRAASKEGTSKDGSPKATGKSENKSEGSSESSGSKSDSGDAAKPAATPAAAPKTESAPAKATAS